MYRTEMARKLMKNNSNNCQKDVKPPMIRSSAVLHQAMSTAKKENYVDENPIVALDIMKYTIN